MGVFNGKKSLNLRVWHWLSFFTIVGLMFTYVFRKTWFDRHQNANLIQNKLVEFGLNINGDNAMTLAKLLREPMWDWHYILGFIFVFLLLFRIFAFLSKSEKCPLKKVKSATNLKEKMVKLTHLVFYFVALYVAISGVILFFKDDLGLTKESLRLVKTLHVYSFWFFLAFIFAHIIGVVKAEISSDKGLISEMFNGGEDKDTK